MPRAQNNDAQSVRALVAKRFDIIRPLHRADVFHARDGRQHVAIFVVPAADHDVAALRRSIETAAALVHPNLCQMRELVEIDDQLVIVSQMVEGVSIADQLSIGSFDPLHVGVMVGQLLSVLGCVHRAGLAHGRVTPATIVIDDVGKLRLMELGLHCTGASVGGDLAAAGVLAGTMVSGAHAALPPQLASWIESSALFPDADASLAALLGRTEEKWVVIPSGAVPPSPRASPPQAVHDVLPVDRFRATSSSPQTDNASTSATSSEAEASAVGASIVVGDAAVKTPAASPRTPSGSSAKFGALDDASDAAKTTAAASKHATTGSDATTAASVTTTAAATSAMIGEVSIARVAEVPPTDDPDTESVVDAPPAPARGSRLLIAVGLTIAAIAALAVWITASPEPVSGRATSVSAPTKPAPAVHDEGSPAPVAQTHAPTKQAPPTPTATPPARTTPSIPTGPSSRAAGEPLARILFSPESSWIEHPAVYVLEDVYRELTRNPLARIEISGHASSDGDGDKNHQLAIKRAVSARNYLVQRGIDDARIDVVLRANQEPIASNETVDGRAQNRRADVRLITARKN